MSENIKGGSLFASLTGKSAWCGAGIVLGGLIVFLSIATLPASADPTLEELEKALELSDDGAQPRADAPETAADGPSKSTLICKGSVRCSAYQNNESVDIVACKGKGRFTENLIIHFDDKKVKFMHWSINVHISESDIKDSKNDPKIISFSLNRLTGDLSSMFGVEWSGTSIIYNLDGRCELAREKKF